MHLFQLVQFIKRLVRDGRPHRSWIKHFEQAREPATEPSIKTLLLVLTQITFPSARFEFRGATWMTPESPGTIGCHPLLYECLETRILYQENAIIIHMVTCYGAHSVEVSPNGLMEQLSTFQGSVLRMTFEGFQCGHLSIFLIHN